jgi:hypothetical protein
MVMKIGMWNVRIFCRSGSLKLGEKENAYKVMIGRKETTYKTWA